jgi:putative solute:sodium symporter small subunit
VRDEVARESGEAAWWRQTWRFAAIVVGGAIVLALVAVSIEAKPSGWQLFGLPFAEFLALIGAPVILAIAAFAFAGRQQALDRRFDVAED